MDAFTVTGNLSMPSLPPDAHVPDSRIPDLTSTSPKEQSGGVFAGLTQDSSLGLGSLSGLFDKSRSSGGGTQRENEESNNNNSNNKGYCAERPFGELFQTT